MKYLLVFLLLFPLISIAQESPMLKEGLPNDLDKEKIIFIEHEEIPVTVNKKESRAAKYLHLRQTNHNRVIIESNKKLRTAAFAYKNEYAFATPSTYQNLVSAGYKYFLWSSVYDYEHLQNQPVEDELIVFEYFIYDVENNTAYKVFEMDEMKVYDSKLMIKRLNKALRKKY